MRKIWRAILETAIIIASVVVVTSLIRVAQAGTFTPLAIPAATMNTLGDIYNALAGTFNSSGVSASSTGSAVAVSRCIITKLTGGVCQ